MDPIWQEIVLIETGWLYVTWSLPCWFTKRLTPTPKDSSVKVVDGGTTINSELIFQQAGIGSSKYFKLRITVWNKTPSHWSQKKSLPTSSNQWESEGKNSPGCHSRETTRKTCLTTGKKKVLLATLTTTSMVIDSIKFSAASCFSHGHFDEFQPPVWHREGKLSTRWTRSNTSGGNTPLQRVMRSRKKGWTNQATSLTCFLVVVN